MKEKMLHFKPLASSLADGTASGAPAPLPRMSQAMTD